MNIPLAFVLILAVSYFASSVFRTAVQRGNEPKIRFRNIVSALETLAASGRGVKRQAGGTYLFWPKGQIGGVSYDGAFATYITPVESKLSFQILTFMYTKGSDPRPSWKRIENFSSSAMEFEQKMRSVLGLPMEAKHKLMATRGQSAGLPDHPPAHR